jgi:hypothetical protein
MVTLGDWVRRGPEFRQHALVHEIERNTLLNDLRRLKLAETDMRLVVEACELLLSDRAAPVPRVVETGLVTAYARSFNSSGRGWECFQRKWTPTDATELAAHKAILYQRNKRDAHTDEKASGREIVDVFGFHVYHEEYDRLTVESLAKIQALAQAQLDRFASAAKAVEHRLGRPVDTGHVSISDRKLER